MMSFSSLYTSLMDRWPYSAFEFSSIGPTAALESYTGALGLGEVEEQFFLGKVPHEGGFIEVSRVEACAYNGASYRDDLDAIVGHAILVE